MTNAHHVDFLDYNVSINTLVNPRVVGQGTTMLCMRSVYKSFTEPDHHRLAHAEFPDKGLEFYDYVRDLTNDPFQTKQMASHSNHLSGTSLEASAAEGKTP
jgi:hypothetical protein